MPIVKSNHCFGIFPGDIIIRTAVIQALNDLREQPWLLDFAFQALLTDSLTVAEYGAARLEEEKQWFLNNEVKVTLGYKINNISVPHIAIWLGGGSEADVTTGDINDVPNETIPWIMSTSPVMTFTPTSYNQETGVMKLPPSFNTSSVFTGMRLLDRGRAHEIVAIIDSQNIQLAEGTEISSLSNIQLANANSLWNVQLEGIATSESYTLDVVVQGDSTKCIVLHALLKWALNRGKQRLLEARGFERSSISTTPVMVAQDGDNAAQILFKRSLTLSGVTKEYWPKDVSAPLQGLSGGLEIASGAVAGEDMDALEAAQGWSTIDDEDVL
jgi:hypothetical protein